MAFKSRIIALNAWAKRFQQDRSGVALIEMAYSLPIFLAVTMTGADTAMFVQSTQKVSQIALAAADNASRLGTENGLQARRVFETQVNEVFDGAIEQSGDDNFMQNARVIVSSIENDTDGIPFIHWQRCQGQKDHDSRYGFQGTGKNDSSLAEGIGPEGQKVTPPDGTATMFVEVVYKYQSLFDLAPYNDKDISAFASYNVRETRDLAGLYTASAEDPISWCRTEDMPSS